MEQHHLEHVGADTISEKAKAFLKDYYVPEEHLGKLFEDVQLLPVFPDSKTFCDCVPLRSPAEIVKSYEEEKSQPGFDLKEFVNKNFALASRPNQDFQSNTDNSVVEHIERLWPYLIRDLESEKSSRLRLPKPFVVPGGRFQEVYYWDTYFTMLGLQLDGHDELIMNMIENCTYLINTIGHIPNGTRTYYVGRSQPPFYALMLSFVVKEKGKQILKEYGPTLRKEYSFWMDGADDLNEAKRTHRRVVRLDDGTVVNRYWDDRATPRPEAYKEDVHIAKESNRKPEEVYRNIRAGAESGWDFSGRWFADGRTLSTIRTTELIPLDLNSLLYYTELTLAEVANQEGEKDDEEYFKAKAEARKNAIIKYCWSERDNFFHDYDFINKKTADICTLAAVFPLFFNIAEEKQAEGVARKLQSDFLKDGGLLTTLETTGQQWDAPNGWAPLHWVSVVALNNYKHAKLADDVAERWTNLNKGVYQRIGKLTEKYNVENIKLEGGGGEYPCQDGFGWTNGVLLKMLSTKEDISKDIKRAQV